MIILPPPFLRNAREVLRRGRLIRWLYYDAHLADIAVMLGLSSFKRNMNEAMTSFLSPQELQSPSTLRRIKADIRRCYYRYKSTPQEYFLFGFKDKTAKERATYLTDSVIMKCVANKTGRKIHDEELNNKYQFYLINKPFFQRKAILIDSTSTSDEFVQFALEAKRIIAKPNKAALGNGVSIYEVHDSEDARKAFDDIKRKGGEWIVEEVITQSGQMAQWNSTSVNTIRVTSFLHGKRINILSPFIRTGRRGSVVDNGGQGGIFASIDKSTGKISTNGMDEHGNEYICHPDSQVTFKGWQIPRWNELMKLTYEVHCNMNKHVYVGWDFALTETGWGLIEGNWGEFVCQQMTNKRGFKQEFINYLNQ